MPWHWEPKKDVVSCEKPWVGANNRQTMDIRMRERACGNAQASYGESIAIEKATRGSETSEYPQEKKETSIP